MKLDGDKMKTRGVEEEDEGRNAGMCGDHLKSLFLYEIKITIKLVRQKGNLGNWILLNLIKITVKLGFN